MFKYTYVYHRSLFPMLVKSKNNAYIQKIFTFHQYIQEMQQIQHTS